MLGFYRRFMSLFKQIVTDLFKQTWRGRGLGKEIHPELIFISRVLVSVTTILRES